MTIDQLKVALDLILGPILSPEFLRKIWAEVAEHWKSDGELALQDISSFKELAQHCRAIVDIVDRLTV